MFGENLLSYYRFLSLFLSLQTILAIDLKSDKNFGQNSEKNIILSSAKRLRQMDESLEVRNRINISATTDWKSNDIEISDQKNGSLILKNIMSQKLFIRDGFVERFQINERKDIGKTTERPANLGLDSVKGMARRPIDSFDAILGNKSQTQLNEWSKLVNRIKRRAEEKPKKRSKPEKKENKGKFA